MYAETGTTHGLESIPGRRAIIDYLLAGYSFHSIIDIGCGKGDLFAYLHSRSVDYSGTGIDMIDKDQVRTDLFDYLQGNFDELPGRKRYDLVFSSHTIEHNANTGAFLERYFSQVREGGVFCLIWPPPKSRIVGGHVHVFNLGLMVYNLVRMGIDCREVEMIKSGYNLALLGNYRRFILPKLTYNRHELAFLGQYFPFHATHNFDGDTPPGTIILSSGLKSRIKSIISKFTQ